MKIAAPASFLAPLLLAATVPAQLVANWVADDWTGTSPWLDRVSGIPAVARGNPTWGTTPMGVPSTGIGLTFNGAGDAFDISSANNPVSGAVKFTAIALFRTTTPGINNNTGTNWWNTTGIVGAEIVGIPNDWGLKLLADSRAQCGFRDNSAQAGNVTDGLVHTTALTWDSVSGLVSFYIDGEFQSSFNQGQGVGVAVGGFAFGTFEEGGTSAYFTGEIGVVQLYASVTDVAQLHQTLTCPTAATTTLSTGCPASQNGPQISFTGVPRLGQSFSIEGAPLLGNVCAMLLGVEVPPIPLAPLGVVEPGAALCLIQIASFPCSSVPTGSVSLLIPWNTMCGLTLDAQWFDYQGSGLEFSTSAVGKFTIGL